MEFVRRCRRIFLLPLWEKVRQGMRGGPQTLSLLPTPHPSRPSADPPSPQGEKEEGAQGGTAGARDQVFNRRHRHAMRGARNEGLVMKVVVLGAGVVGTTSAYYLARAGHAVTVIDRQPRPGARDELCQCRRGLARLRLALGRPRHSAQGAQMAGHAPSPAHHPAAARRSDDPLGPRNARQLQCPRLRRQQGAHGAHRRIQPRRAQVTAGRDRHRL